MRLAKWDFLKIIRDAKSRVLLIGLFLFIGTFSYFYQQGEFLNLSQEYVGSSSSYLQTYNALTDESLATEQGQEIDRRLARNQTISGMLAFIIGEEQGNTVDDLEEVVGDFVDQSMELNENILFFYDQKDFPQYDALTRLLPPEEQAIEQFRMYEYMSDRGIEVDSNQASPGMALYSLIQLLSGVFIIIIAAVSGADSFSRDQESNWSVTQGLPITWQRQWNTRAIIHWSLLWGVILLGIVTSFLISLIGAGSTALDYPVPLYQGENVAYVSVLQYAVIVTILVMMLSYLALKLSIGMSFVFRNIYLTVALVLGVCFIPYAFLIIPPVSEMNPLLYLQIAPALEQWWYPLNTLMWQMILSFIILYIVIELVFWYVFTLIPTRTGKLERRRK